MRWWWTEVEQVDEKITSLPHERGQGHRCGDKRVLVLLIEPMEDEWVQRDSGSERTSEDEGGVEGTIIVETIEEGGTMA